MPYRNEHSCRLLDPDEVDVVGSETREHEGKKYRVIFGKPKGSDGSVEQAYRYPLSEGWTEAEARAHCKEHGGILFEPAEPEASLGCRGRERKFLAAVHSIETGEEENLATFYLMNTTVNLNGWGVSDKALGEALPTVLRKPLGCGPGYRIDDHYPDAVDVGRFVRSDKPDGYALGTAEITDSKVWGNLVSGEWGPISVVILSYRETCSRCGEDHTQTENPFSHGSIAEAKAYVQVESFVFERADFIDVPAVPQAGLINVAAHEQVPLEQLARFYEAQSQASDTSGNGGEEPPEHHESQSKEDPAQGPGAHAGSNPEEEERKKQLENELQQRVTELEQQLVDERKAREAVESQLTEIQAREHAELVEETLTARVEAGLVEDTEQERERLTARTGEDLREITQDARKVTAKLQQREAAPKAKYTGPSSELKTVIEDTRLRLFGRRNS